MTTNEQQIKLIAMRIHELRDIENISIEEISKKTGISIEEYLAYESGTCDFSFSHLFNIAEALGVDISDLLTGESPKLNGYVLTRHNKGLEFKRRDQYLYHHLAYNFKDKLAESFIVTVKKDEPDAVKQLHSHEGQELNYVLKGTLKIVLGGKELYLQVGDSLYYDSTLPHAMYALEGDCQFIAVVVKEGGKTL